MNPEIKAKWIAALRSGEYKQAHRALRTYKGHCCLGVLCDLVNPNGWMEESPCGTYFEFQYKENHEIITTYPSLEMRTDLNLPKDVTILVEMNDGEGKSFKEIADFIEENF